MDGLLDVSFLGPGVNDTSEELTKPLLTNVCCPQHILLGSGIEHTEKHATKQPIASRLNIKNIMAKTIAYMACQPQFALSLTSQWGMQDGLFSLLNFYYNITALFFPLSQWAEETLASWD
ncbi:hypothetical protein C0989_006841, partial [Termitomyces sp. Mn162]